MVWTAPMYLAGSQENSLTPGKEKFVFPTVMFSHGLGGIRACYSAVCGEMASNGFIVVAIEHQDRSGAWSYVNLPPNNSLTETDELGGSKKSRSYRVSCLFSTNNQLDTSPRNAR